MNKNRLTVSQISLCALFTALIAIGAFIRIPIPLIPFTLQMLFTMLAGLLLGPRLGALSVLIYVVLGLVGVPVFTQGGGLAYVFQPTFGYLIGFIIGTYLTGYLAQRQKNPTFKQLLAANFAGMTVIYACGLVYCYLLSNYVINVPLGVWPLFLSGCLLVLPADVVLALFTAKLAKRLRPALRPYLVRSQHRRPGGAQ